MYIRQPIFWLSLSVLALVAVLNNLAFTYYLYWLWPWFDKGMHFLAGLLIGWVALWLYFTYLKPQAPKSWTRILVLSLMAAFIIGAIWEMLEFGVDRYNIASVGLRSLADLEARFIHSLGDILADLLGGLVAAISFKTQAWLQK